MCGFSFRYGNQKLNEITFDRLNYGGENMLDGLFVLSRLNLQSEWSVKIVLESILN